MSWSLTVSIPGALLLAVSVCAVWSDLSTRRIPNRLIVLGLAAGLAWQLLGPVGAWAFDPHQPGATGLFSGLAAGALMLVVFLPAYMLGVMGAGDVKLLWVIGTLLGASPGHLAHLACLAMSVLLSGGVLALYRMTRLGVTAQVLRNVALLASRALGRGDAPPPTADRMPYAVAIAVGSVGYVLARAARWIECG